LPPEGQPKVIADASRLLASTLRTAVQVVSGEALTTERSAWRCRLGGGSRVPASVLPPGDGARLFDFELAGYRHDLLDVAYLYLGFHCCYQPGRIPPAVLGDAEAAYRKAARRRHDRAGEEPCRRPAGSAPGLQVTVRK
jgi:hypothetical protein